MMGPNGKLPISNLAQLEVALQMLPSNLRTRSQSSDMTEYLLLDFFEDDKIFTPGGSYFDHAEGEKIVDFRARIFLLLSNLFSADETEPPSIRLLGAGPYNMVVGVDVKPKTSQSDGSKPSARFSKLFGTPPQPKKFALRIPVEWYLGFDITFASESTGNVYQDMTNLQVIGERLDLPIPKILHYDMTCHNSLDRPYTLQNCISGKNLALLWNTLNLKQKVSAIEATTRIVEKIASITAPAAGHIAFSNVTSPSKAIKLTEFLIPTKDQAEDGELPDACEALDQAPVDFLMRCCSRWIRHEENIAFPRSSTTALWHRIIDIIQVLEEKSWLGDCFYLAHGDLFPRNILVEVINDTAVKITGIVDWDMACFAPRFFAFRSPFWAWNGIKFDESNEDGANTGAFGMESKAIKDAFLNTASPEYAAMGLAEEAIIARKLFRIVTHGLLTDKQQELAEQLIAQWDKLHPALSKNFVSL